MFCLIFTCILHSNHIQIFVYDSCRSNKKIRRAHEKSEGPEKKDISQKSKKAVILTGHRKNKNKNCDWPRTKWSKYNPASNIKSCVKICKWGEFVIHNTGLEKSWEKPLFSACRLSVMTKLSNKILKDGANNNCVWLSPTVCLDKLFCII